MGVLWQFLLPDPQDMMFLESLYVFRITIIARETFKMSAWDSHLSRGIGKYSIRVSLPFQPPA